DSIMRAGDLSSRDQSLTLLQLTLRGPLALDRRHQLQLRVLHLELLDLEILRAQRNPPAEECLGAPQLGPRHLEGRLILVDRDLATLQGRGANLHLRQDILVEEPAQDLAAWPHQAFLDQAHVVVGAHRGGALVLDDALLQQDDRRRGSRLIGNRCCAKKDRREQPQPKDYRCSSHVSLFSDDVGGAGRSAPRESEIRADHSSGTGTLFTAAHTTWDSWESDSV